MRREALYLWVTTTQDAPDLRRKVAGILDEEYSEE